MRRNEPGSVSTSVNGGGEVCAGISESPFHRRTPKCRCSAGPNSSSRIVCESDEPIVGVGAVRGLAQLYDIHRGHACLHIG